MYSLKDLSTMTMLSDRTLRNYLDAGILQGRKENGAWVFTSEQIKLFLQNDMVKSAIRTKKNAIVKDFIVNSKKKGKPPLSGICRMQTPQKSDALSAMPRERETTFSCPLKMQERKTGLF